MNKQIIRIMTLAAVLICMAAAVTGTVSAEPVITVGGTGTNVIITGQTVTIPVTLSGNTGLGAFDIHVEAQGNANIAVNDTLEPLGEAYQFGVGGQISANWINNTANTKNNVTLFYIDVTPNTDGEVRVNLDVRHIGLNNTVRWNDYIVFNGTIEARQISEPVEINLSGVTERIEYKDTGNLAGAVVYDQYGAIYSGANLKWSSRNTDNITVTEDGAYEAIREGTAVIHVEIADNSSVSAEKTITVYKDELRAVSVNLSVVETQYEYNSTGTLTGAVVYDQYGDAMPSENVKWSSSNLSVFTVTEDGAYEAKAAGTAELTAKASLNETALKVMTITVYRIGADIPVKVVINKSQLSYEYKTNGTFSAVVYNKYDEEITAPLTWSSNNKTVMTVTPSGVYETVYSTVGFAEAAITASAQSNQSASDTFEITAFRNSANATKITITGLPDEGKVIYGDTGTLSVDVVDQYNEKITNPTVKWTSDDENVINITDTGVYTAVGKGTANITAQSGSVEDTASLTVPPVAISITIKGLSDGQQLNKEDTGVLTASVYDQSGDIIENSSIIWSSNNTNVISVTSEGIYTANSAGTALVTVAARDNTSVFTSVNINVINPSLTITEPALGIIYVGEDQNFTVSGTDVNETTYAWAFGDGATASGKSAVHAYANTGTYTVTVTAQTTTGNAAVSASRSLEVRYRPQVVTSVEIGNIPTGNLIIGAAGKDLYPSVVLNASVYDQYNRPMNLETVTWASDNTSVLRIDGTSGYCTAVGTGSAVITATSKTNPSVTDNATITVKKAAAQASKIIIIPTSVDLTKTNTFRFSAVVFDQFGLIMSDTPTWIASNSNGTITPDGLFTAENAGETTVTASISDTVNASAVVTISPLEPEQISIVLPAKITRGTAGIFSTVVYDKYGKPMDVPVTWTSSTDAVQILNSSTGSYYAKSAGTAVITVTAGSITAEITTTVEEPAEIHPVIDVLTMIPTSKSFTLTGAGSKYNAIAIAVNNNTGVIRDATYNWISGNSDVVSVTSLPSSQMIGTATPGSQNGTVDIVVSAQSGTSVKSGNFSVTVTAGGP